MELELWLLCHGIDFMLNRVYWVGEVEREEVREHRFLEEAGEEEETMK